MNPRLGSFALAEFMARNEHGNHHVVVNRNKSVHGIFGYMSSEHMDSGEATATAADVYSYGVVLLEILTGEPAVDFRRPEVIFVHKLHKFEQSKRPYEDLADRRLTAERLIKEGSGRGKMKKRRERVGDWRGGTGSGVRKKRMITK
ncbi:hypothetical protein DM860_016271 [Cuscuta australis]|uniref:Protein kinase domain-containing protein n=1 Tax=Cuscuta australis TaxID=267555 RepID=A0A328E6F8_9ASTE|nr:hypothetical protein DM860_016271 [Cuscuta australis]